MPLQLTSATCAQCIYLQLLLGSGTGVFRTLLTFLKSHYIAFGSPRPPKVGVFREDPVNSPIIPLGSVLYRNTSLVHLQYLGKGVGAPQNGALLSSFGKLFSPQGSSSTLLVCLRKPQDAQGCFCLPLPPCERAPPSCMTEFLTRTWQEDEWGQRAGML